MRRVEGTWTDGLSGVTGGTGQVQGAECAGTCRPADSRVVKLSSGGDGEVEGLEKGGWKALLDSETWVSISRASSECSDTAQLRTSRLDDTMHQIYRSVTSVRACSSSSL